MSNEEVYLNPLPKNSLGYFIVDYDRVYKNKYGDFIILNRMDIKSKTPFYKIRFINTNNETVTTLKSIMRGNAKDTMAPIILGVAYIDGLDISLVDKKLYNVWHTMIYKCYDANYNSYKKYGAKGVRVSDSWLHLKNFLNDAVQLPGYYEMLSNQYVVYNLDKDILQQNVPIDQRVYSKETCMWVPWYQNNHQSKLDTEQKNNFSSNYRGVYSSYNPKSGSTRYTAEIYVKNKKIIIGTFTNEIAAANAWNWYALFRRDYPTFLNDVPYMPYNEWLSYKTHTKPLKELLTDFIGEGKINLMEILY